MKRIITITTLLIMVMGLYAQPVQDQITMSPGYAYDVFYSMETGEVGQADRSNWDIAFYTAPFSAGIITNGPEGVDLYLYPNGDTTAWDNIDTTGLASWTPLYNDQNEWENGAFNRNALGHPDYGWGIYNQINHNVIGDSIYIIKLTDGSFKKLWINRKISVENRYLFEYANLDGSMTVSVDLQVNDYLTKNFVYYSMVTDEAQDREPSKDSWDIVFTQYMADQEVGGQYPVTGVLNNVNVAGNMFEGVGPDFDDWTTQPLDTSKVTVGYEWKSFDLGTFSWTIVDSLAYFLQTLEGDVYKLVFTAFEGQATGVTEFEKMLVSGLGIGDPSAE